MLGVDVKRKVARNGTQRTVCEQSSYYFTVHVLPNSSNAGIDFGNNSSRDFELSENEFVNQWAKPDKDGIHQHGYGDA